MSPPESRPTTLYQKLSHQNTVKQIDAEHVLLYIDLHILNEYTSPQAFSGIRSAGRSVFCPEAALAIVDHVNPTRDTAVDDMQDKQAAEQIRYLTKNCAEFGIEMFGLGDPRRGIEHVVAPEQGFIQPGMVVACGDSHTTTYGAFGALGFGIGTSDVEHVLCTQTVVYKLLKNMKVEISGKLSAGATSKDLIMAVIAEVGAAGAVGQAIEFGGEAIKNLSMAGRMTLCNMAMECGARAALIAPDQKTLDYLKGRPRSPSQKTFQRASNYWRSLASDAGAEFDRVVMIDASDVPPLVTFGTSPDQSVAIDARIPDPSSARTQKERDSLISALAYMDLTPGTLMTDIRVDHVFIGSCTNSRLEDLRDVARVVNGRRVADGVRALIVPGSQEVKRRAEAEGLAKTFTDAGFEWRHSGCSMCLAMNDDVLPPGARCASSTNRNFEGRQGRGARTHLMSPAMAAAAAINGKLTDIRRLGAVR